MKNLLSLGIDLGGTHVRLAMLDAEGRLVQSEKNVVGSCRTENDILNLLSALIISKSASYPIGSIGVGLPGIVSSKQGIVFSSPHYPKWHNFEVKSRLETQINEISRGGFYRPEFHAGKNNLIVGPKGPSSFRYKKVFIDNDANAVAYGELHQGTAVDWSDFLMITLGTGVGGAIVIQRKIFSGNNGFAGEFGHMVIECDGPPCACGSKGCLETFVSATGLIRMAEQMVQQSLFDGCPGLQTILGECDSANVVKKISEKAARGDKAACYLFQKLGEYLAVGIASLVNVTGIEKIVLGGGLAGSYPLFKSSLLKELPQRTYQKTAEQIEIRLAHLGDEAGSIGAAYLARENEALTSW